MLILSPHMNALSQFDACLAKTRRACEKHLFFPIRGQSAKTAGGQIHLYIVAALSASHELKRNARLCSIHVRIDSHSPERDG